MHAAHDHGNTTPHSAFPAIMSVHVFVTSSSAQKHVALASCQPYTTAQSAVTTQTPWTRMLNLIQGAATVV